MQANTEHQENDADFSQLGRQRGIGCKAGRKRPHQYAGNQISDQRRQAEPIREVPAASSQHEADCDRCHQCHILMHALPPAAFHPVI